MKSSIRLVYRTAALFSLIIFSAFVTLSQTSWRGITSTAWGTASNWTAGVPTAGVDAIIGDANFTGANQPTVNVAAMCRSLSIGAGSIASTLTVSNNVTASGGVTIGANGTISHGAAILSLTGNWSNSGTYNATNNAATVTFAGAAQSLTGATTFRTMIINAGSTLTLNSAITVDRPLTVSGILDPGTVLVTLNNNFVVNTGGTIRINTALYAGNYSIDPTTLSGGSTVEFSSTSTNQILHNGLTYGTLLISGSMTKFLIGNLPALSSNAAANGNIIVTGGTLDMLSFTANRGVTVAGGTLSVSDGATLKIGGTNSLPANFATHSFGPLSTVQYNGTTQSIAAETYGNLLITSAGNKTAAGAMSIAGNFSLSNATFIGGSFTHGVSGNWTMSSGTFTNTGTTISINGGSAHNVTSTGAFNNLTINAAGGSVVAGSDLTVNGILALSGGIVTTGASKVIIPTSGSVTRTSGHVNGFLQKHAATGPVSLTYEVGDASSYAPADVFFANVTSAGDLIVSTTAGDHPSIGTSFLDPVKDVNRYWTTTNLGSVFTSYDVTLHFLGGDLDAGANPFNFEVNKYNDPTWAIVTTGTRASTLTQALGLTSFSAFAVGERKNYIITATAGANGTILPPGNVSVRGGDNQSFTITPSVGYHVDSVLVDGVDQGPVGTYTFFNVNATHTIRAVFAIDQFTITAVAGANGSISPSGSVAVDYGTSRAFTVRPDTGYHIDSVIVDGVNVGPVGSYVFTNVTANHTIRTVYAIDQFTITATAGANGTLTPTGAVVVNYGANQAFTITPNTGYHIDSVLVDGVNQGPVASYTFLNVTANHTIRTVYAINQFTISATAGANGSISPSGAVVVNYGSNQAFTITPNLGFDIDSVLVDGVDQGPVASHTFTNVTANHTIRTVYAVTQFTITATAGANGSLTPGGLVLVNLGADQAFTITPNTGYHIDSVLVDGVNQGPVGSYTFTNVTADHTIRTVYAIDLFTITATAGANGSLSPSGSVTAGYGSNQSFTITPNTGYHIDSVLVDGVDVGQVAAYAFTNVTADHTIRTVYAIDQFTITATAGANGSISPSGSVVVSYGADQSFTITPNTGYHIDSVLVDGADVGPVGAYTFNNVTADHTIRTVYAIDQFTITATTGPNGSITPSGSVVVNYGSNQSYTITPNTGYHIDSVLADGVDQGPVGSYTFTNVTADHTIRTVYSIDQFTINATTGLNGSITPSGSIVVDYGTDQSFTITPNTGYHIADVQVDSVSVGQVASHMFSNVTANHTIHATFEITQYTISASAGANGSIAPSGAVLVDHGNSQAFTIATNTGYHIDSVLVDGVDVGPVGAYTFSNVTADHTIRTVYAIDQFTITATTGPNGSITPSGSVLVDYGSNQAFTITPNAGYHIDSVLVDGVDQGPVGSYSFTNVTADHTIRTVYAIDQFTITATTGPNGAITPTGAVVVSYGSNQGFTIIPNTGYHIADVQVDSVSVGQVAGYSFTNVTANHTIHATFAITQYTINASAGANGSIAPSGAVLVDHGNSQGFVITPNTGYHIADVQVDSVSVGALSGYTFTNVTANHSIHATFAITQYTISASAGSNGSITPSGAVLVDHGASQGFTISANTGYHIDSVLVDGVDVGPVGAYTFSNVTADHTIRTVYAIDLFTITSTAGANGSISPSGSVAVGYGSNQSFTITPNTGYFIADVQVDSVSVGPLSGYTFTNVTANHTIQATFAITQYTISASAGANGSIAPSGAVLVDHGASQSFTVTANTGYHIADVQVDSVSVGPLPGYTFTNVTANHTIHATFAITQYTITATAGANGTLTPNGAVLVNYGADQGFTITANTGYHIDSVLVDGVDVGPVGAYSFTNLTADHTIRTVYSIDQFTIASSAGANGSISPSGAVAVGYGSNQSFTITPNTGYFIADVQVDSVSAGPLSGYTFTNVTANHTIHATFAITQYTISASAGPNGSISPSGAVLVDHGASQGFTISANTGYYVADVQIDSVSVGSLSGYSFTNVTANHTIHATFAITQYAISASAGPNGSIAPSGAVLVNHGALQSFTITPNVGYHIADVLVDSVSVGPLSGYTFTNVIANHTIFATFSITQYTVTAVAGSNGTVSPTGSTLVNYGDSLVYTITPDNGYYIVDVQVDTVSVGAVTQYTFTSVTANHLISASFAELNRAPSAVRLLLPARGDTLVIENLGPAVGFTWSASADADVADSLLYSIHLSGPGIDSVLSGLTDTTLQWGISSMLQSGGLYWWTVNVTDGQAVTASPDTFTFHVTSLVAVLDGGKDMPKSYALFQNFPNPFNPTTVVRFDLPRASEVRITVYNLIGQEVAVLVDQASMGAGHHEVSMDASAMSSGIYLYRITAKGETGDVFSSVRKMVLVK